MAARKLWTKKRIVEAWHGEFTLAVVAQRSGNAKSTISRIWADAKEEGLLPPGDRPHFPQNRRPEKKRDVIEVRSVKPVSGFPPLLSELLQAVAGLPNEEDRLDIAELLLASIICRTAVPGQSQFFKADLSAMHVVAHCRKHVSGERPLPVLDLPHPHMERISPSVFAEPYAVLMSKPIEGRS